MRWLRRKRAPRGSHGGHVGVFGLDDRVLLDISAWWEKRGYWTSAGRIDTLAVPVSDEELGTALQVALQASEVADVVLDQSWGRS